MKGLPLGFGEWVGLGLRGCDLRWVYPLSR